MQRPTRPFREEHEQLLVHVGHSREAGEGPRLSLEERAALVERIVAFLRGTLVPHSEAAERFLYPQVARPLDSPGATAAMAHAHVAVCALSDVLANTDPSDV